MDQVSLSTDKVLLTVFVSILVGFVTAVLSIVRLVNDKESKTTDYRQSWNDSLRKCFAELISHINILAGSVANRHVSADHINSLTSHQIENDEVLPPSLEKVREHIAKKLLDDEAEIRELRRKLHHSYALTRLHFKPNDLSFSRIEQKFDVVLEMLNQLSQISKDSDNSERAILKERIHAAAAEMTGFARDILKTEWEAVKRGEHAYQRTKFWSLVGGAVALVCIALFGLVTTWSMLRVDSINPMNSVAQQDLRGGSAKCPMGTGCAPITQGMPVFPQSNQTVNVHLAPNCPIGTKGAIPSKPAASRPCG